MAPSLTPALRVASAPSHKSSYAPRQYVSHPTFGYAASNAFRNSTVFVLLAAAYKVDGNLTLATRAPIVLELLAMIEF